MECAPWMLTNARHNTDRSDNSTRRSKKPAINAQAPPRCTLPLNLPYRVY
jgi:hypothetical protein